MAGIVLLILAALLFCVIAPFGIITQLILLFIVDSRERNSNLGRFAYGIAHAIDIMGNVCCGDFLNIILIKHREDCYKFGRHAETISSAVGKNVTDNWHYKTKSLMKCAVSIRWKHSDKLTMAGNVLYNILDFAESNHCIKSIQIFE